MDAKKITNIIIVLITIISIIMIFVMIKMPPNTLKEIEINGEKILMNDIIFKVAIVLSIIIAILGIIAIILMKYQKYKDYRIK